MLHRTLFPAPAEADVVHVTNSFREAREWGLVVGAARLDRARRTHEAGGRMTVADTRLLWLLTEEGPKTMREVSEALGLEQSTVNRQVNAALERGLVERVDRSGVTARSFRITPDGAELFSAEVTRGTSLFAEALDVLPDAERTRFVEQFAAFARAYGEAAERHAATSDPAASSSTPHGPRRP